YRGFVMFLMLAEVLHLCAVSAEKPDAPLPQSNARSMGRLYPARSHPAGVLLPGRSGAAILDSEPPSTRSGVRPYARTCGRAFIDPDWAGVCHDRRAPTAVGLAV